MKISIFDNASFEISTVKKDVYLIEKGTYTKENDILTENRNNKFNTCVILYNKQRYSIIPEWFDNQKELENFLS